MKDILLVFAVSLLSFIVVLNSMYDYTKEELRDQTCTLHFTLRAMPAESVEKLPSELFEVYDDPYYTELCLGR